MRRLAPVVALAAVGVVIGVIASGGGGGSQPVARGALDDAVGYFPRAAPLVAVIDTDSQHAQGKALAQLLVRVPTVAVLLRRLAGLIGIGGLRLGSVLDDPLVVGLDGADAAGGRGVMRRLVVAARVRDPVAARRLVLSRRHAARVLPAHGVRIYVLDGPLAVAVDGRVLVAARTRDAVARALGERRAPGRMHAQDFDDDVAGLPADALVRVSADPRTLIAMPRLGHVRWIAALRRAGATLRATPKGFGFAFRIRTKPDGLTDSDLPLAPGHGALPPLIGRRREIAVALREPARVIAFVATLTLR